VVAQTKLRRYQLLLSRYWWVVALATAAGLCIASVRFAGQPPSYLSSSRMMVSGQFNLQDGVSYREELANFFGTQTELMQAPKVRELAVARVKTLHPEVPVSGASLAVAVLPKTSIFVLSATGPHPEFVRRYLDATMEGYMGVKREMRGDKTALTQTMLTGDLARLEKEIRGGEDELLEFQRRNNVGFLQEEGNSAGAYLSRLNRQLADLKTESRLLEKMSLDQHLERQADGEVADEEAGAAIGDAQSGAAQEYQRARRQIDRLKAEMEEFGRELRPRHPIMIDLAGQIERQEGMIDTLRRSAVEQLKTRREAIRLQIENLEASIREWETKALDLSERLAEYNRLKAKVERARSVYDRQLTNWHSVDMNTSVEQDMVSVLETATPAVVVRPGLLKSLLTGGLLGLLVGLGFLVFRDQTDDRMASLPEFESRFAEKVLATIPRDKDRARGLLGPDDDRHAFAEAFRALRSSLLFMKTAGEPPRAFLVTSAVPDEGKTTVAANLALTMAFSGVRVLLVDADLRRGALHRAFTIEPVAGLTEVLAGEVEWRDAIYETAEPNLSLLSRGSAEGQPGELLLGPRADALLADLYREYDYVVFDTCPVLVADDTTSLAPKVDATLLVFRFDHSLARATSKALGLLRERQANILGAVCNDLGEAVQEYYYHRYANYYRAVDEKANGS
jgi:capsular exopolysaccharide synthesis family protein